MQVSDSQASAKRDTPADWIIQSVGSAGEVRAGKALAANGPGSLRPYLRTKNVLDGRIVIDDVLRMPMTDTDFARYRLRYGDVLLNEGQSIELVGRCAIYRNEYPEPCAIQNQLVRFRAFPQTCPAFAHYLFRRCQAIGVFASIALQTTSVAHLGVSRFERLQLAWPASKSEQEAIAGALADTDGWIESLEKLIAKKRQIKHGVMQQLLTGKRRLPGFSGEWHTVWLGKIADIKSGGTPSTNNQSYWGGTIPWCTPTDTTGLHGRKWLDRTERTITTEGLKASSAELIPANSVVMTSRATIGECAINRVPVTTNQGFKNFVPHQIDVHFLYYLLLTQRDGFVRLCGGSTFLEIGKSQLQAYEVSVPRTLEEQAAIGEVLSAADVELELLEEKLAKARLMKQEMMQNLLTGRVRLLASEPAQETKPQPVSKIGEGHNWQINEAVVISVLTKMFGSEQFPLGRKRYTKLSYLLHRHAERKAVGYLKKAAGPYNPSTRYGGPEKIALGNKYVRQHKRGNYEGFVQAEHIGKAQEYFNKWYGAEAATWLEQFRYARNDDLELWATVDMAMVELRAADRDVTVETVKEVVRSHPEWLPKLDRELFADKGIADAIEKCGRLFGPDDAGALK